VHLDFWIGEWKLSQKKYFLAVTEKNTSLRIEMTTRKDHECLSGLLQYWTTHRHDFIACTTGTEVFMEIPKLRWNLTTIKLGLIYVLFHQTDISLQNLSRFCLKEYLAILGTWYGCKKNGKLNWTWLIKWLTCYELKKYKKYDSCREIVIMCPYKLRGHFTQSFDGYDILLDFIYLILLKKVRFEPVPFA